MDSGHPSRASSAPLGPNPVDGRRFGAETRRATRGSSRASPSQCPPRLPAWSPAGEVRRAAEPARPEHGIMPAKMHFQQQPKGVTHVPEAMQKTLLMSILVATFVIPIRNSSDRKLSRGLKRTVVQSLVFLLVWGLSCTYIYWSLPK